MRSSILLISFVILFLLVSPGAQATVIGGNGTPAGGFLSVGSGSMLLVANTFQGMGYFSSLTFGEEEENPDPEEPVEPPPVDLLVPELEFSGSALFLFATQYGSYSQYDGEEADLVRSVLEPQYLAYAERHRAWMEAMNAFYVPTEATTAAAPTSSNTTTSDPAPNGDPSASPVTFSFEAAIASQVVPAEGEVPEPATLVLCALALPVLLALRRS